MSTDEGRMTSPGVANVLCELESNNILSKEILMKHWKLDEWVFCYLMAPGLNYDI